jgi:hypothetical protein
MVVCNPSYKGGIGRTIRWYLKITTKAKKDWGAWLKWQSTCFASERP